MRMASHPFLLALAIGVGVIIAYATLDVSLRVSRVATRRNRPLWLFLSSLVIAGGLWSAHWLCMQSTDAVPHFAYDWRIGNGGWLLTAVLCGIALKSVPMSQTTLGQRLWISVLAGLSMFVVNYAAFFAMRLTPAPDFNPVGVVASLLWPVLASFAALGLIRSSPDVGGWRSRLLPSLLIVAGFFGANLIAVGATVVSPDARCDAQSYLSGAWIGVPYVLGLAVLVGASRTLTAVDNHDVAERERAERDREHAERVRRLAYYDRFTALPNRTLFNATLIKRLSDESGEQPAPFGLIHVELAEASRALQAGAEPFVAWLRNEVVPNFAGQFGDGVQVFRYALGSFMLLIPADTRLELAAAAVQLKGSLPRALPAGAAGSAIWSVSTAHFPSQGLTAPALMLAALQDKNTGADSDVRTGEIGSATLTLA